MPLSPPNHIHVILREEPPLWQEGISGGSLPRPSSKTIVPKRTHECNPFGEETAWSTQMTIMVSAPDGLDSRSFLRLDPVVGRGPHSRCATHRTDRVVELRRRHLDPPSGARHPADRLLH